MKASMDRKISDYKTYLTEEIVGTLETDIEMPKACGPYRAIYKLKANKYFATMKLTNSFFVEDRTIEAVKRWIKDWRLDLRATGKAENKLLAERGFVCKNAIVKTKKGVRVWRFK